MKKNFKYLFTILFILQFSLAAQEAEAPPAETPEEVIDYEQQDGPLRYKNKYPTFDILLQLGVGSISEGNQAKFSQEVLNPKPESTDLTDLSITLSYYFLKYVGFDLGGTVIGRISAKNKNFKKPLDIYAYNSIKSGPVVRILNIFTLESSVIGFYAKSGINYTWVKYLDTIINTSKSINSQWGQPSRTFESGYAKGLGWYAGGGIRWLSKSKLFGDIGGTYEIHNTQFAGAKENFDAKQFLISFGLGVSL